MLRTDLFVEGIPGEYQIERLLGQSQLGAAYLAQQPAQSRRVMITTFNLPEGLSAQEHEQLSLRLDREGKVLVQLAHPHILPVYAFGVQASYLYLVTAFVKEASLAQFLKGCTRFTPQQTLSILKQLATALDYMHDQGVVHGMLSLSNVIVSGELNVRIAGFGLRTMLELHGIAQNARPLGHLTSGNGTFLGWPEYISPERVLGLPADTRSDVYALGVMLFELLSGIQPFRGTDPLDIALQRLQKPIPSIHAVYSEVPEAFDLVLSALLERDPMRRIQSAGEAATAFGRVVKTLDPEQWSVATSAEQAMLNSQVTFPPTVNWFDEPMTPSGKWQVPPVGTAQLPYTTSFSGGTQTDSPALIGNNPNSLGGVDPFAWWTSTSNGLQAASPSPGTFSRRPSGGPNNARSRSRPRPAQQDRRRVVSLIVSGTAAAGVLALGGISLARLVQSPKLQQQLAGGPATGPTTATGNTPAAGMTATTATTPGAQTTPTSSTSSTPQASPTKGTQASPTAQPTQGHQPTPTPRPNPTPTPKPGHTGTVIGSTSMATNSAAPFGSNDLLIHLGNGNFVACNRACTHVGVTVNYDPGSKMLVCPAHGAVFDPQNGFALVSGPGNGPLATIAIRVNADGTITTG